MRSPGPPAHEAASAVPPVRRLSLPAHEAASAVPPVRSPGPPAHEAASAVPSRAQTKPSCSRDSLGSPIPCADLAFLLTRQPRQSHPVRRPGPPAHETASAVPPVRRPGLPAHEAASAVPPVRSPGLPAYETASAVPPVRSPGSPAHEEDQNKAFVRERVTFAHGRIVEPFSVARKDCGTLTGCVMALLSLARGVPFVLADRNRR